MVVTKPLPLRAPQGRGPREWGGAIVGGVLSLI